MGNDDPIVLYLIVRQSLKMSPGKIGAQCGHAVKHILIHYFKAQLLKAKVHDDARFPVEELVHIQTTTDWLSSRATIVTLRADDKEWIRIKDEYKDFHVVKDAGLTEVVPGSETVIALWPQFKSKAQETIVGRLQCL